MGKITEFPTFEMMEERLEGVNFGRLAVPPSANYFRLIIGPGNRWSCGDDEEGGATGSFLLTTLLSTIGL